MSSQRRSGKCKIPPLAKSIQEGVFIIKKTLRCDRYKTMPVHIGKEIRAELQRQERGVTWLAGKLHCDRTNVYNIFKRQGIDTRLLERISVILHRNFFTLYCQDETMDVENDSTVL